MQRDDEDKEDLAGLAVGGAEDGVQVAQEEGDGEGPADADEGPVEDVQRRPADERHRDPDQVRVAVERPALEQVGRLGPEVPQRPVQRDRDHERVTVYEARGAC